MNWNTFWAWGASSNAGRAANETYKLRKEIQEQNKLLKKSAMSAEQIAAEENSKTIRQSIWTVVAVLLFLIGACIAYPVFGVCVAVIVVGIIIFVVIKNKKNKSKIQSRKAELSKARIQSEARKNEQKTNQNEKEDATKSETIKKQLDKLLDMSLKGLITEKEYEEKSKELRKLLKEQQSKK